MGPKKFSFLSIIICTMLMLVPVFMMSLFLIICCHFMFNILFRYFSSNCHSSPAKLNFDGVDIGVVTE